MSKKYFSISEAANHTGLKETKLRYIEKFNPLITTKKIKGRRYYNLTTMDYIKKFYNSAKGELNQFENDLITQRSNKFDRIVEIEILIKKFQTLMDNCSSFAQSRSLN